MSEAFGGFKANGKGDSFEQDSSGVAEDVRALQERLQNEFGGNADAVLREFAATGAIPDDASAEVAAEMSHLSTTYDPDQISEALGGEDRMAA